MLKIPIPKFGGNLKIMKKDFRFTNKTLIKITVRLVLAIAVGVAVQFIDLDYFEFLSLDWRTRFRAPPPKSNQVVTIAIDKKTISELGGDINASIHNLFLQSLLKHSPLAIVYMANNKDIIPISGDSESINELVSFTKDKPIFIGRDSLFEANDPSQTQMKTPFNEFKTLQAPITHDKVSYGKDGVTRRVILSYTTPTMYSDFAYNLGLNLKTVNEGNSFRGEFERFDSRQVFINFRPTGSYNLISFVDILKHRQNIEFIKDKIVLVGDTSKGEVDEFSLTPYSRQIDAMTNLEVVANSLDTLILNNGLIRTPVWLRVFLTCLVSILTIFVVLTVRPANGLVVILLTLSSLMGVGFLMLSAFNIFIDIAHPLLSVFLCYYFFIPYRLIIENRRSWEYYHKNKLLTQVEELKSNFIRMMSHDLKTPLARIQGMADIVKRENNLNTDQVKAINTISESSQELTDFIGSILSLGRVESQEIKLNLQSRDINSILQNVIKKLEFQAQAKNIQILCEFEPMFSVKVDEELIKQVFTNLIENAIKYSPENSKVLVSTEDSDGKILIQIADQGMGINKQEQKEIFSKFYRSRQFANGPIKGSGLGLYLAKYFIDLHLGNIAVESELNKGSTFTVELPTELEL
jgi:signal transduction histidine kinase